MSLKYELPEFLADTVSQERYERWLGRKAIAQLKRDRRRGNTSATREEYRLEIHRAVTGSGGRDAYTGEELAWNLISKYDNRESQARGRSYKHEFGLLPTVDHLGDGTGPPDFVICSWRTNDGKHDLAVDEFLALCQRVLEHHGCTVRKDS